MIKLRQTEEKDLKKIQEIITQAQEYMRQNNIDQWTDGYPSEQVIKNDMTNGHSYVLQKDEDIVATAMVSFDGEPDYDKIYEGAWLSQNSYAVIHRIATDNKYKGSGISSEIIKAVEKICSEKEVQSIKIDTHRDNLAMQKFLQKNGFKLCGMIYLIDGSERLAFEKLI